MSGDDDCYSSIEDFWEKDDERVDQQSRLAAEMGIAGPLHPDDEPASPDKNSTMAKDTQEPEIVESNRDDLYESIDDFWKKDTERANELSRFFLDTDKAPLHPDDESPSPEETAADILEKKPAGDPLDAANERLKKSV